MRRGSIFVPMKPPAEAKSRLAQALSRSERELLSLAMLQRVLRAATAAPLCEVTVVGGDGRVRQLAARLGAAWLPDPARDLNRALAPLFAAVDSRAAVYLPADLPLLRPHEVTQLVEEAFAGRVVLAPDRTRRGTNALAVPGGLRFRPMLGEDSFARHLRQASDLGADPLVLTSDGLELDVDTPSDLAALLEAEPGFWEESAALRDLGLVPEGATAAARRPPP